MGATIELSTFLLRLEVRAAFITSRIMERFLLNHDYSPLTPVIQRAVKLLPKVIFIPFKHVLKIDDMAV